ncbi:MAG: glycosyltransferase family 2 protein, partial [Phascolarctobacterium sp.]|nr:glycosyltransferase family 2 protein [Candidatus Phascolarctobacterium equi]
MLSVIVPVYKVEKYLPKCVDSIINQTYKDLEIILVDDGSPDNCPAICDEYAKKDSRIKVIHQENGGLCSARNTGIENAEGDFISFIDSDDWIEINMFEEALDYLHKHDLDVVCCDTKVIKGNREIFRPRYRTNMIFNGQEGLNEILAGTLDNSACNKIYKRICIGNVRFPLGRHYEDVATTYLVLANAKKVGFLC